MYINISISPSNTEHSRIQRNKHVLTFDTQRLRTSDDKIGIDRNILLGSIDVSEQRVIDIGITDHHNPSW